MTKVCIFLSTYNGSDFFDEQLDSLLLQEGVDVSVIIRDDGSSYSFKNYLQEIANNHKDKTRLILSENVGFAKSFYELVSLSSNDYDYYAFSDQDDVWFANKIRKCVQCLKNDNLPELCFCNCFLTDSKLNVIRKCNENVVLTDDKIFNLFRNPAQGCSMVFNKAAKEMFLKGDPNNLEYHDHWLYVICSYFGNIYYVDEPLFYYRQHGNNQIGASFSLIGDIKHRKNMLKKETHYIQKASLTLLDNFSDVLSEDDKNLLTIISEYRDSFRKKWKLLMNKDIKAHLKQVKGWFYMRVIFNKV